MGHKKLCIICKKSYSIGTDFTVEHSTICPQCGNETVFVNQKFKPPSRSNVRQWKIVEYLVHSGYRFHSVIHNGFRYIEINNNNFPKTMTAAKNLVRKLKNYQ